tara:strand:+ start:1163 stop:1405 length:243 start_codon:yes stop_codon:yes gene_type:complete
MKIMELVGTPADQQGKPDALPGAPGVDRDTMDKAKTQMGAEENPAVAAKQKQEQKKVIQDQIRATREQLKQLQTQLAAIK